MCNSLNFHSYQGMYHYAKGDICICRGEGCRGRLLHNLTWSVLTDKLCVEFLGHIDLLHGFIVKIKFSIQKCILVCFSYSFLQFYNELKDTHTSLSQCNKGTLPSPHSPTPLMHLPRGTSYQYTTFRKVHCLFFLINPCLFLCFRMNPF